MKFKLSGLLSPQRVKKPKNSYLVTLNCLCWGLVALGGQAVAPPATIAAEKVTLRLGAFEQAIAVSELEKFAKTGALPPSLQVYSSVLTPQVREVLNRRLQLDPKVADKFIADVSSSPSGKQFLTSLGLAVPDLTLPQLQAAVSLAAQQANGINLVGVLKAYPEENITIDATSAIALALDFNPSALQSRAIAPTLATELLVISNTPFRANFDPAAPGKATVKQETLFLQDKQRYRSIPVDIYYPQPVPAIFSSAASKSPSPLVVISPGFGADRKFFSYLARHLASYGLTVAALEHPDSKIRTLTAADVSNPSKLLPATEFINRPKDISFLLDELAKVNRQPGNLQGKLNTAQVSVIGHSLGGYTALAVAGGELNIKQLRHSCQNSSAIEPPADWLQCAAASLPDRKIQLRDRRVQSAIALNPLIGNLFGKNGLAQVATPTLMLASTDDKVTPILNHQLRPFEQLQNPKYLITAVGGTHLSVGNPGISSSQVSSTQERRGTEVQPLRQLISGVSLAFIEQLTPEAKIYAPFLTSAYAQSLSTPKLGLRLNTQLPANITSLVEQPTPTK